MPSNMLRYQITFLIFQDEECTDTVTHTYEFIDSNDLAQKLATFATQESQVRWLKELRGLNLATPFLLPRTEGGYGPDTHLIIKEIKLVE